MMTIQRYYYWKNEFGHFEGVHQTLHSIPLQKRATLGNLINHIDQLLLLFKYAESWRKDPTKFKSKKDYSFVSKLFLLFSNID
jgi:hypothetical protein